jgi:hypothetical protein
MVCRRINTTLKGINDKNLYNNKGGGQCGGANGCGLKQGGKQFNIGWGEGGRGRVKVEGRIQSVVVIK